MGCGNLAFVQSCAGKGWKKLWLGNGIGRVDGEIACGNASMILSHLKLSK